MEFKVGDKVKLQSVGNGVSLLVGDICKVIDISKFKTNGCVLVRNAKGFEGWQRVERMELITPKITKNQRITALEEKVAELQAQLDELKQPKEKPRRLTDYTNNEKRKMVIDQAKLFVKNYSGYIQMGDTPLSESHGDIQVKLYVNAEKRTVVAVPSFYHMHANISNRKGIAKCHPHDVFNEHIGKAIALGRALGLDVSEFEQAVQPDEVVVGMEVLVKGLISDYTTTVCESDEGLKSNENSLGFIKANSWFLKRITNDTNAEYPS